MIGPAGDHRSVMPSACTSLSMVSRKSLSPRIHDLLERFRPDMPPKHIGYLARRSLR